MRLVIRFFAPEERDEIQRLVMQVFRVYRSRLFGHEENHVFDNHFWQFPVRKFMQAALVFYDKEPLAMEYLEYLYEVWTSKAPASGFNRDGNWHNGTSYFSANAVTLYYMASLCSYLTKTDFMSHPWYQNAGKGLVYSWPPRSMSAGLAMGMKRPTTSLCAYGVDLPISWPAKNRMFMRHGILPLIRNMKLITSSVFIVW